MENTSGGKTQKKGKHKNNNLFIVEQFSIECRRAKTKVLTLTNHKRQRQSSEPIKSKRGKTCATSHDGFDLPSDWMKKWREIS